MSALQLEAARERRAQRDHDRAVEACGRDGRLPREQKLTEDLLALADELEELCRRNGRPFVCPLPDHMH